MPDNNNSRRSFIRSMTVLSAALLIDSPATLFASTAHEPGLPEKWRRFWRLQGGSMYILQQQLEDVAVQTICKGHSFKIGSPIVFANEQIIAQPIWIYWEKQKTEPDDVVISFFTQEDEPKKICRINRYELEALHHLATNGNEQKLVAFCKTNTIHSKQNAEADNALFVKTTIRKKQPAKIMTTYRNQNIVLEQEIIYNV